MLRTRYVSRRKQQQQGQGASIADWGSSLGDMMNTFGGKQLLGLMPILGQNAGTIGGLGGTAGKIFGLAKNLGGMGNSHEKRKHKHNKLRGGSMDLLKKIGMSSLTSNMNVLNDIKSMLGLGLRQRKKNI